MSATTVAVMTMVRDESFFLDIWLRYYSRALPLAEIFVYDHLSSDGSIEQASAAHTFHLTRETHPAYDDFDWYTRRIEEHQRELLADHDIVVFAESDELIWHRDGLAAYLDHLEVPAVRCTGFQVIAQPDEAPIAPRQPLLAQRSVWFRRPEFDKALITTLPLSYSHGFHQVEPPVPIDPDLLLIHLHTIDRQRARDKKRRIASYSDYDEVTRASRRAWHNRLADDEFDAWWTELQDSHEITPIPSSLRLGLGI